jgi:predicted aconitase with swiveling domain
LPALASAFARAEAEGRTLGTLAALSTERPNLSGAAVLPELATAGLAALFVVEFLAALAYAAWLAGFPLFHLV